VVGAGHGGDAPTPARPIGIFDSGLGGLTVARAVIDLLPNESVVYYGDTARFPYGPKPLEEVHGYATGIIEFLVEQDVKLVVVGCNSASSALRRLGRPKLPVPLVDVIEPPAQTAVRQTRNRRIGVIGTEATVSSGQYEDALRQWAGRSVHVVSQACPAFVELAERGEHYGSEVLRVAEQYLGPLKAAEIDTLVLGCTHYPLLAGPIRHVMGPDVLIVSSAEETAQAVYTVLVANDMLRTDREAPSYEFLSSGEEDEFLRLGHRFLGPELNSVKRHPL
jgi:glutamate racemase